MLKLARRPIGAVRPRDKKREQCDYVNKILTVCNLNRTEVFQTFCHKIQDQENFYVKRSPISSDNKNTVLIFPCCQRNK